MKKVLIASYYFPPCPAEAAQRTVSWAKHLSAFEIAPTVITRHWKGNETDWLSLIAEDRRTATRESKDGFDIIRLPYIPSRLFRREQFPWKIPLFYQLFFLWQHFRGRFELETDAWTCFRQKVLEELNTGKYHAFVAVAPPHNLTPLVTEVSQKYRIHTVLDFQEAWKPTHNATESRQNWEIQNFKTRYTSWLKPIREIWTPDANAQTLLPLQKQILTINPCIIPSQTQEEDAKLFAKKLADRIHTNWEQKK